MQKNQFQINNSPILSSSSPSSGTIVSDNEEVHMAGGHSSTLEAGFYSDPSSSSTAAGCGQMSIVSLTAISIICLLLIFFRNYVKDFLLWLETTDATVSYVAFLCMFTIVSFPVAWGYFLLLLTTGYVYGFFRGVLVVLSCAAVGVTVAYLALRNCCRCITLRFYSKRLEAVIKVVEGPQGYKVIALARLTPIPFGLQNGMFGLTHVSVPVYTISSVIGMTPLTLVNCYVGSTFRSMEEVWTDNSSHVTGYFIFIAQLCLMACLMMFVVRKAREELRKTVMLKSVDDGSCYCDSQHHNSNFYNSLSSDNAYISVPCSICMNSSQHKSLIFTA